MKKILAVALVAASVMVMTGCQKEEEKPGAAAFNALKSDAASAAKEAQKAADAAAKDAKKAADAAAKDLKNAAK